MVQPIILACLFLAPACPVWAADDKPAVLIDARRLKSELPSTWESTDGNDLPKVVRFIKHITPTNFVWIAYDRDRRALLGLTGGSWSLKDGHYHEAIEYATDDVQHLRGKTYGFAITLDGDRWEHKGLPDIDIAVDQVWKRAKPEDRQKKNTAEPARVVLGTWEKMLGAEAPKAGRMLKHVTPTHWTWVAFDRENKRVLAAAGGTWAIRDGEYLEDCEFATENVAQLRGGSFPFKFRVEGDRWTLKGGADRAITADETWTRLERPNPQADPVVRSVMP